MYCLIVLIVWNDFSVTFLVSPNILKGIIAIVPNLQITNVLFDSMIWIVQHDSQTVRGEAHKAKLYLQQTQHTIQDISNLGSIPNLGLKVYLMDSIRTF